MAAPTKLDRLRARMSDMETTFIAKDFIGMIYGGPGGGKTTTALGLAHALAGDNRIIMVDSSDGWVSLEKFPALMRNVQLIPYEEISDLTLVASQLKLPDAKRAPEFKTATVVVIDEISSIAADVLDTVQREQLGIPDDEIPNVVPEWTQYFPQKEITRKALEQIWDINGIHVILVAHAKSKADHRKVIVTSPDFPDKLGGELQKKMHVTAYATAEQTGKPTELTYNRQLQSWPSGLVLAKSRISGLPFKASGRDWIKSVASWIESDEMVDDLAGPEPQTELGPDALPADGIPLSDSNEDSDGDDDGIAVDPA